MNTVSITTWDPFEEGKPEYAKQGEVDPVVARYGDDKFFQASTQLMTVLARACGRSALTDFHADDLTTFRRDMSDTSGVPFVGLGR